MIIAIVIIYLLIGCLLTASVTRRHPGEFDNFMFIVGIMFGPIVFMYGWITEYIRKRLED